MEDFKELAIKFETSAKMTREMLEKQASELEKKKSDFAAEKSVLAEKFKITEPLIELNVGGKYYTTYKSTLCKHENTVLEALFSGRNPQQKDANGRYFIDRDGKIFRYILHFLRSGEVIYPESETERRIFESDLEFFGLSELLPIPFFDSKILSEEQQAQLNTFYGNKNQRWELLYRASRDGFGVENFRLACNFKAGTVTVLQTANGYVVGGFTNYSWGTVSGSYFNDPSAFLFSFSAKLPNGFQFKARGAGNEVHDNGNFPIFGGGHDLMIQPNRGTCSSNFNSYNRGSFPYNSVAQDQQFKVLDMEVFHITKPSIKNPKGKDTNSFQFTFGQ